MILLDNSVDVQTTVEKIAEIISGFYNTIFMNIRLKWGIYEISLHQLIVGFFVISLIFAGVSLLAGNGGLSDLKDDESATVFDTNESSDGAHNTMTVHRRSYGPFKGRWK